MMLEEFNVLRIVLKSMHAYCFLNRLSYKTAIVQLSNEWQNPHIVFPALPLSLLSKQVGGVPHCIVYTTMIRTYVIQYTCSDSFMSMSRFFRSYAGAA